MGKALTRIELEQFLNEREEKRRIKARRDFILLTKLFVLVFGIIIVFIGFGIVLQFIKVAPLLLSNEALMLFLLLIGCIMFLGIGVFGIWFTLSALDDFLKVYLNGKH